MYQPGGQFNVSLPCLLPFVKQLNGFQVVMRNVLQILLEIESPLPHQIIINQVLIPNLHLHHIPRGAVEVEHLPSPQGYLPILILSFRPHFLVPDHAHTIGVLHQQSQTIQDSNSVSLESTAEIGFTCILIIKQQDRLIGEFKYQMKVRTEERQVVVEERGLLLRQENLGYSLQIQYDCLEVIDCVTRVKPVQASLEYIPIKAMYGILSLSVNQYLIVVTRSEIIAEILSSRVYRVLETKMLVLSESQNPLDIPLKQHITEQLSNGSYYYSDEYNLTLPLSSHRQNSPRSKQYSSQNRYFYNYRLVEPLLKLKLHQWITPFVHGSIVFNYFTVFATQFNCSLMLISRMDRERQGARWFCRGCDDNGHTSFKVETQMVFSGCNSGTGAKSMYSIFQIRGQTPLIWSQHPDIMPEPQICLMKNQKINIQITKRFMLQLKQRYDSVCLINLLDKSNQNQKRMGQYYQSLLRTYPLQTIRYIWLDFKMSDFENNLPKVESVLADKFQEFIKGYGYYHLEIEAGVEGEVVETEKRQQKGAMRMSSIDCLIRIDIAQRVVAKELLQKWVYQLGIVTDKLHTQAERLPESMEQIFNQSWAMNSHRLSKIYTGTTNVRQNLIARIDSSRSFKLRDIYVSFKRYILGTFYDWNKQNINDILSGKLDCKGKLIKVASNKYLIFLVVMIVLIVWGIFELIEQALEESRINNIFPIQVFWSIMAVIATFIVIKNNKFLPKPEIHY